MIEAKLKATLSSIPFNPHVPTCQEEGCEEPVTHRIEWRDPGPPFDYHWILVCAKHNKKYGFGGVT